MEFYNIDAWSLSETVVNKSWFWLLHLTAGRKAGYSSTPVSGLRILSQTRYPDIKNPDSDCPVIEANCP